MNTKLNKSDWIILFVIYGFTMLFNAIDYYNLGNKTIEYLIDFPTYVILSTSMILILLYLLIPEFLIKKKQYFIFMTLGILVLTLLGSLSNLIGYLSNSLSYEKYPTLLEFLRKGLYNASDMISFPFGVLLAKKFYEGQLEYIKIEKQQKENELKLLRSQLDPHFLFNNLNTLDALVDENPKKAKEYINRLASIYRYLIQTKDSEVMELSKEMNLAENYIFLIKTRFGDDYNFTITKNTSLEDKFIPTGALQTLLENVIKHNKATSSEIIQTKITLEQDKLSIYNKKSTATSTATSFGTGIENLKTRYKLLTDIEIKIINDSDTFTVTIPIISLDI